MNRTAVSALAPALAAALVLALAAAPAARLAAQAAPALPRSTPERQGIASSAILDFVQAADTGVDAMHGFMLVRHGHVVAEGWWGPYDARTPHMLYSLSKSFTSTAVGIAAAEGKLSVDDPVLKWFPEDTPKEPSPNLRGMRVRDLLRMNTGQTSEAPMGLTEDSAMPARTWVQRFLAHPVPYKPGTHFLYNTPATYMLSAIVQKATGETVLDYLEPRLFTPLGIARPTWGTSPEGVSLGGYGLNVRTEDIARFGQLLLQKGVWNGRQLVPAAWVEEATRLQTSNGSNPQSDWDQGYGYQFWRSRHGYRGDGAFGQFMLVLPEQDAVVAITSGTGDMGRVMHLVWEKLLPAMQPAALPEDATAQGEQRTLQARLAGLTVRAPRGRATSPLASRVSGRWYELAENERGVRAVSLDLGGRAPALVVRTTTGETRTPIGVGAWVRGPGGWADGIERQPSAPAQPAIATNGAWTADSVFTLRLLAPETPFYSTMTFTFTGDRLLLDSQQNVGFGPTKRPRLEGTRGRSTSAAR